MQACWSHAHEHGDVLVTLTCVHTCHSLAHTLGIDMNACWSHAHLCKHVSHVHEHGDVLVTLTCAQVGERLLFLLL